MGLLVEIVQPIPVIRARKVYESKKLAKWRGGELSMETAREGGCDRVPRLEAAGLGTSLAAVPTSSRTERPALGPRSLVLTAVHAPCCRKGTTARA